LLTINQTQWDESHEYSEFQNMTFCVKRNSDIHAVFMLITYANKTQIFVKKWTDGDVI